MWEPPESWTRLTGIGPASDGVWRVPGNPVGVAKRLLRPEGVTERADQSAMSWWRREADLAEAGVWADEGCPVGGLRAPDLLGVVEDEGGVVVVHRMEEHEKVPAHEVAHALGRFGCSRAPVSAEWALDDQFGQRLAALARRGGWMNLRRTGAADLADALWRRRSWCAERLALLERVPAHGDLTPQNVLRRTEDGTVLAVDWANFGSAPPGHDLGYYFLSVRESLEDLVDAYLRGRASAQPGVETPGTGWQRHEVLTTARTVAVFTALTRADWALGRVVAGEGALAAKLWHPSVSAHLRPVQRLEEHLLALLGVA